MITEKEYKTYFGVDTAPTNLVRLEVIALNSFNAIMVLNVPSKDGIIYEDFKKALMEQINYFCENPELIESSGTGGFSLGSYSESSSNNSQNNSKTINRVSPVSYDILLTCGLLYSGIER